MKNIYKIIVATLVALMVMTGCDNKNTVRYEGYGAADPYPDVTSAS